MPDYPEKTCSIDRLVNHAMLKRAALAGQKTEQRRNGVYAYPGERFEIDGQPFELFSLDRERLGDMTEEHARAEGFDNLEGYRDLIVRMHKGMAWNPDHLVWVHRFRAVDAPGEARTGD
jgi:hypothetical protein